MEKIEITQENLEKEKLDSEEIILDVGGTKYITKRSILIKYPNTLLGEKFLDPSNCNDEHFFDRNGRAFHYIMEFYRTGEPLWPDKSDDVTYEEVKREFKHFQIPSEKDHADTLASKEATDTFNTDSSDRFCSEMIFLVNCTKLIGFLTCILLILNYFVEKTE
ncbi:hypothetical protein Glove_303g146 [Diversispora epigaea]|uniref:BTB domain-containing protein n=1 Tax=Diversispora epigaea TaxID=1348612 RepID=A0A397HV14_9GLOM|nr:hypothetical protein Glove_303g146 [Diversispora epigaea]